MWLDGDDQIVGICDCHPVGNFGGIGVSFLGPLAAAADRCLQKRGALW